MNIIDILHKLGWNVLSFNEDGQYKIQLGKARKDLTDKKIKDGLIGYEGSTSDIYNVKVSDVGFNRLGNLYAFFEEIETDYCIDAYEYKNMGNDELF